MTATIITNGSAPKNAKVVGNATLAAVEAATETHREDGPVGGIETPARKPGAKDPAKAAPTGTRKVVARSDKAVVVQPGTPAPEVIGAAKAAADHDAEVAAKAPKAPKAKAAPKTPKAKAAPAVRMSDLTPGTVAFWEAKVAARGRDVRWTEKHDPHLTEVLAKRRARLAEAEKELAAARKAEKSAAKEATIA